MAPTRLAGRYVLRELIASGGMGEVHLATDERLGRQVAVKVLSRALTDSPESVERFRREALAAAGLSHPNVARVYDYGVEGERHFIVMEHLEGRSLDRLLRDRGSLAPDEAVAIGSQVCAALGAAHRAGIVHRDVKPGNVMVAPDGTVKVTDFGISKALGASPLTDTGTILGTAAYLPPEVGRGASAGPKSDLYSLGIVLYQMLTGQVPFAAESPVAVAMRHVSEDVPAPSGVVPGLPAFLDDVVARATRRDPDERFASAEAMGEALQGRDTQPIPESAAPEPTQPMTRAMAAPARATEAMSSPAPPPEGAPHSTTRALPILTPDREHTPHDRGRTGRRRRRGALVALAAALLIGLGALGTSLLSGGDQGPTATTPPSQVPSSTASPTSSQPSTTAAPAGVVPAGLVGSDLATAEAALKKAGLSYRWRMVASDAPRNQVIEATPAAGTAMPPDQPVMLTISRGPANASNTSQNSDTAGNNNGNGNSSGANGKAKGRDKGKGH